MTVCFVFLSSASVFFNWQGCAAGPSHFNLGWNGVGGSSGWPKVEILSSFLLLLWHSLVHMCYLCLRVKQGLLSENIMWNTVCVWYDCVCVCIYMYACACVCVRPSVCISVYISVYVYLCACVCVYISVCVYLRARACVHVHPSVLVMQSQDGPPVYVCRVKLSAVTWNMQTCCGASSRARARTRARTRVAAVPMQG